MHHHNHHHCQKEALAKAEFICADQNARLTPIRKKVLEMVWASHHPVKAYDLLEKLQEEDKSAKPVTIYRALDFLLEQRLIHKLESYNAFVGCTHPSNKHHCAFLICDACQNVEECCSKELVGDVVSSVERSHKFQVKNVTLEIRGVCGECG